MEDDYHYDDVEEPSRHRYDDDDTMSHADGGDNSSHHDEHEDDVFSDNSPRSSMGSMPEGDARKNSHDGLRSPRISDIQQYDGEVDYVPTAKGTPRPPFRSPSSVKAMQMSSPAPSVVGSGQPRSGRRSALPTVSRLGSPNLSAQYSPKKTPPRFKKNDPPLVLLHVTLLPLRWSWGDVLDEAKTSELSEGVKTLREAWRQLQDTIGDTIQDRGVLLPHPQNDFEVMEERLLEALELPFKRRARILECGHYLGPSNEMPFADEHESDDDDAYDDDGSIRASAAQKKQTHWCSTCHCEIRFDALGAGKIYRVKVYASNGLLRAGAWEACWKEMERVDIELEPMLDAKLQDELVHLAARQDRAMPKSRASRRNLSSRVQDVEDEREDEDIDDPVVGEETMHEESFMAQDDTTASERYRDMFGGKSARTSMGSRPSMGFSAQDEGFGQSKPPRRFTAGSFPEMVVNAFKALLDDKRNLAILLLSALTLVVALRGGVNNTLYDDMVAFEPVLTDAETPTAVVPDEVVEGVEGEGEVEVDADGEMSPTSPVIEVLFTPQSQVDGENPCAAMEPQTVEKWMTATVTEMTTVTRTEMPHADAEFYPEDEDVAADGALKGETLTLGDGMDEEEMEQEQGQSHSQWGGFRFPW